MLTEPAFYATAIPAVILLGLSKGGFAGLGVLGMPLMALTIPPVQAAAVTLRGRPRLPAGGRPGVARHLLMRTQGERQARRPSSTELALRDDRLSALMPR